MSDATINEAELEPVAPAWPRVVKLKHPVQFASRLVTELTFRRGKIGDMKNIKLGGESVATNDLVLVASRMCGETVALLDMLDVDDAGEVLDIALDFFAKCLEIAMKRSR